MTRFNSDLNVLTTPHRVLTEASKPIVKPSKNPTEPQGILTSGPNRVTVSIQVG